MSGQLKLKVLWAKSFIGISIDQVNIGQCLPITVYYFWPKTDAWEQLKLELGFKPWVDEKEQVRILNTTAELMDFWRESRSSLSFQNVAEKFPDITFVAVNT
jgi:30S ribosomal protein 3